MIPKWLSPLFTAAVEGYAAIDRATARKRLLANAQASVDAFAKMGKPRTLVVVRSPEEGKRLLSMRKTSTAVVFLDCALERCDTEDELLSLWNEAQRASGSSTYNPHATPPNTDAYVFVLTLQPWSTARLLLDPRVRWVILQTPPKGPLRYRPYGRRSTLLADVHDRPRPTDSPVTTEERVLP